MFCGPVTVLTLVVFISPGQSTSTPAVAQTSATAAVASASASAVEAPTNTSTAVAPASASAVQAPTNTSTEVAPASASAVVAPTPSLTVVAPPASTAVTPAPSPASAAPTSASVTAAPTKSTCANLGVKLNIPWGKEFETTSSEKYKNVTNKFSTALETLYNDSAKYGDVKVSEVTLTEKDEKVLAKAKLCLVFKGNDEDFIEDVFRDQVKKGKLSENLTIIENSAEFEAVGVSFTDWKAKEGECEKKCEGAGGPFIIVGTCESVTYSCEGLKKTKTSKECPKYCPSSAAAITVSTLILAIGIFLSFSFQ